QTTPLPFYTMRGLWKRISCVSPLGLSIVSYLALTLLYPLFHIWNDCFVSYFSIADGGGRE
ncbi:MAG: hypothetical protein LBC27_03060, partial [Spirochaetaceae bacterium]|nr:hypothetical protein [Spirochaetaceae bacterium]